MRIKQKNFYHQYLVHPQDTSILSNAVSSQNYPFSGQGRLQYLR